jgi:hypothetical protein
MSDPRPILVDIFRKRLDGSVQDDRHAILIRFAVAALPTVGDGTPAQVAARAFDIADAMLVEFDKRTGTKSGADK